jgi:hypothetical protein
MNINDQQKQMDAAAEKFNAAFKGRFDFELRTPVDISLASSFKVLAGELGREDIAREFDKVAGRQIQ